MGGEVRAGERGSFRGGEMNAKEADGYFKQCFHGSEDVQGSDWGTVV